MLKRSLKYTGYLIGSILLLIFLLLAFTQTSIFKRLVKDQVIEIVNKQLNGELSIEQLGGNFFNHLTFHNLAFTSSDSLILSLADLTLEYDLKTILNNQITIDSIHLSRPFVNIWQNTDSTWNLQHLIPTQKNSLIKTKKDFPYVISAEHIKIDNGHFTTHTFFNHIPKQIIEFNLQASIHYQTDSIFFNLQHLELESHSPSLSLRQLSTQFHRSVSGIGIDSLIIRTGQSFLSGDGRYQSRMAMQTHLEINPLAREEFQLFVPQIQLITSPNIYTKFKSEGDTILSTINLQSGNEIIKIDASIRSLWDALKNKQTPAPFSATIHLKNVQPNNWIQLPETHSHLNGQLKIKGSNLLNYKMPLALSAVLDQSSYQGYQIDSLRLNAQMSNDSISFTSKLRSAIGGSNIAGNIKNFSTTPIYNATITGDSLLPNLIIPQIEGTLLNTKLEIQGRGFSASDRQMVARLALKRSNLYHIPVDSAYIMAQLDKSIILLDSFDIFLPGGAVHGNGKYNLQSNELYSDVSTNIDSITFTKHYLTSDIEFKSFTSSFQTSGHPDSISFEGYLCGNELKGYATTIQDLTTKFDGTLKKQQYNLNGSVQASHIAYNELKLDTITSFFQLDNSFLSANTNAEWTDTLQASIRSDIRLEDTLTISIPQLELNTLISEFYSPDTTQCIQLYDNNIAIHNFKLNDRLNPNFNMSANGNITLEHTEQFNFNITDFNLWQLNRLIDLPDSIGGYLSTEINLAGQSTSPELSGSIRIDQPRYGALTFSSLESQIKYANQKGETQLSIPGLDAGFLATLSAPFQARFDSTGFTFSPPETFEARLKMDSLNISQPLNKHATNIEADGILSMDIEASGPLEAPLFFGNIQLDNGKFIDPKYGIYYDQAKAHINFDANKINIDTFLVKREKGFLSATGNLEFDSTLIKGNIISSSLIANADQFFVTRHKNYEIQIDASTYLKTGNNKPEFGGQINVRRSDFYLPAFIASTEADNQDNDEPLLVQALTQESDSTAKKSIEPRKRIKSQRDASAFMEKLTGRLQLEIPRNTWLKSEEMKLEIWGDLEIVKTSPYFELFGEVGINRGHYILYGKKLTIQEGQIIFQGGEEIDPNLNFVAQYVYRGADREKRELEMNVSGILSAPEITFNLDGSEIPEADAVSILIFGKTMDEMSFAGQNSLVGSMGSNMVAQAVTSQLSKTLGTRFNLDMIEVNATENWQSAAFVVGKYITNDLFVIYQRGFGESEDDEITPETITLEYEIKRIIFVRLQSGSSKSSGFDVILKFEPPKED
ncbi:MAG: translocation/assembly module TamB domain-containing protein [Marinilabiliaceae bacterium]|nr:translocation/assembly module TamB domain-containing protein [Marinilabiliaceae bacterium]